MDIYGKWWGIYTIVAPMLKIGERGKNMNDVGLEKKENNLLGFEEMFKPKEGIEHQVFSTIKDGKVLFNLDSEIDYRLNSRFSHKNL